MPTVVNLETPLGRSGFTGYPCFNAPVSYAEALHDAGFDLFLTANNHTLDRRDKGLKFTVHHCVTGKQQRGIHVGHHGRRQLHHYCQNRLRHGLIYL